MGGTSLSGCADPVSSVLRRLAGRVEPRDRATTSDTLLGPEGSGPVEHLLTTESVALGCSPCLRPFGPIELPPAERPAPARTRTPSNRPYSSVRHDEDSRDVRRPYLENCTVDASIQ